VALAEKLNAPVVTTFEGRGSIPEDHHLCIGPRTDRRDIGPVFEEADVMLAVGTRFQNYATRVWQLRLPEQLIHIDADPHMIGLNYPAKVPVVGDAKLALAAIGAAVTGGTTDPGFVDRTQKALEADVEQTWEEVGPDHRRIASIVRDLLPRDANIVRDSTVPVYLWGNRVLPILEPRTSIRPSSVAIGPGMAMAVGAAAGSGRRTLLMQGDGGLMLGIGEMVVAAEYDLPIIVCIFNDRGYGVLRQIQTAVMDDTFGVDLHTPDFVKVADGMGIAAEAVVGVDQFEAAFARAVERPGPTVLDIDLTALAPMTFPIPPHQRKSR